MVLRRTNQAPLTHKIVSTFRRIVQGDMHNDRAGISAIAHLERVKCRLHSVGL